MHTDPVSPRLRFARFEFVRTSGELYREGIPVHLQEQPSQVLAALLERPGEIVSRETLRERLWGSDTFVDFEHGLNTAVKKLRQALGDSADAPVFIETLARRGYRFIGQVESMPSVVGAAVPARIGAGGHCHSRPAPRRPWVSAAGMWRSRLGGLGWRAQSGPVASLSSAVGVTTQLAVMPFRVLADPAGRRYLGIGMADAITTRLAGTRQVGVRPTSAVLPFRGFGEIQRRSRRPCGPACSCRHHSTRRRATGSRAARQGGRRRCLGTQLR